MKHVGVQVCIYNVLHQSHHRGVGLTDGHLLVVRHVRLCTAGLHLFLPPEGADVAGVPLDLVGVVVEGGHDGAGRGPVGGGSHEGVVGLPELRLHHGHVLQSLVTVRGEDLRGRLETLCGRDGSVPVVLVLQGPATAPNPPPQTELTQLYREPGARPRLQF